MEFRNCLLIANRAGSTLAVSGAGLYSESAATRLLHCTVATNEWEGVRLASGTLAITNSILWANGDDLAGVTTNVGYTCIEDGDFAGTNGCISANPRFVDTIYCHLQSTAGNYVGGYFSGGTWAVSLNYSPCLDTGDPTSPYALEPIPNNHRANLGAYGNTEVASKSGAGGSVFKLY